MRERGPAIGVLEISGDSASYHDPRWPEILQRPLRSGRLGPAELEDLGDLVRV